MPDVLCLGEILVDWVCTSKGAELDKALNFTKAPGGAPANVAVGLARQDVATAFIGRVAADAFGIWLKELLHDEHIDTTSTVVDAKANTRMAYVVTDENGDRKLAEFSRVACADARLHETDLDEAQFANAAILHFGSISLIEEPAASATAAAVKLAKKHGLLVSYDPNVRLALWQTPEQCRNKILDTLSWADLVKINSDELQFLTGSRELSDADNLCRKHEIEICVVTLDAGGCYFATSHGSGTVPGFPVELVEATGAGDGFVSALLAGLLPHIKTERNRRNRLKTMPQGDLINILTRANAVGAIACTKPGAIPSLPGSDEIDAFIDRTAMNASA